MKTILRKKNIITMLAVNFIMTLIVAKQSLATPNKDSFPESGLYVNEYALPAMDLVDKAQSTLDIEIYEMNSIEFRQRLRNALARDVKIRIVKDPTPLGNSCRWFEAKSNEDQDCKDQKLLVEQIKSAKGSVIAFNKSKLCGMVGKTCYEHGKMIIADNKVVLLSTGNFSGENFCGKLESTTFCTRDYSYVSRDPEVLDALNVVFKGDLESKPFSNKILTPSLSNKITISPFSLEPIVRFIQSATQTIEIQNQYLKEPTINQALIDASKKGISVKLVVAGPCAFGKPSSNISSSLTEIFKSFDAANIMTRIFPSSIQVAKLPGYMHAKVIVIDGKRAWMGSVNGSQSATSSNREFGVFFNDPKDVNVLKDQMTRDFINNETETWEESLACKKDIPFQ